jgi:hypothetical protein
MRCHICDAELRDNEIERDSRERGGWKPCRDCRNASGEVFNTTLPDSTDIVVDEEFDSDGYEFPWLNWK